MTLSLLARIAGLGLAASLVSFSGALAAPPNLVSANPGAKDGWTVFPKQLRLTFNAPIASSGTEIQLMDPDGRRIRLGTPVMSRDGVSVATDLTTSPPVKGPYMVTWQAKSAAGEDGKGAYSIFVD